MDSTATILNTLNLDCLIMVMSFLDDYPAFYSFALTCKLFHQISLQTKEWNLSIKLRKINYYFLQFIEHEYLPRHVYRPYPGLQFSRFLRLSRFYKAVEPTYLNIKKIYESGGPVAAELLTWTVISNDICWDDDGQLAREPIKLWCLCLPDLKKRIMLQSDCGNTELCWGYLYTRDEDGKIVIDSSHLGMGELVDILQEELGETDPPITEEFCKWLCCYPLPLKPNSQNDVPKIIFKDPSKNKEPNQESIQQALDRWDRHKRPLRKTITESNSFKIVENEYQLLEKHTIKQAIKRPLNIVVQNIFLQLSREFKDTTLQKLILFLSLRTIRVQNTILDSCKHSLLELLVRSGEVLKVKARFPSGEEVLFVDMSFILPGGQEIQLHTKFKDGQRNLDEILSRIQPVTELLRYCLKQGCGLPHETIEAVVSNDFTLEYFERLFQININ